jgi:UDP-GlcNAc3NAcA epimerase
MKIVTVLGARPQFIKAAVLSRLFAKEANIKEVIVHTGQHFNKNMSDVFFKELNLPKPAYHLGVHSLPHGAMTGQMLESIEKILLQEKPDWLLVYGDTNSTLAGALAAAKLHIPVAHVEAGLRSNNLQMPEEINRILTDKLSTLNFAPTVASAEALLKEGIPKSKVKVVGDVMYDSLLHYKKQINAEKVLANIGVTKPFVLATLHRQENLNHPQKTASLLTSLEAIAQEIAVVLPVHPRLQPLLTKSHKKVFTLISPQPYLNMLALLQTCSLVLTDSGGLQKEAFYSHRFCITLREETEWQELVDLGVNELAGSNQNLIRQKFKALKKKTFPAVKSPYGDGKAGLRIVQHFKS